MLVSLLIFPHQMKYSMFYIWPVAAYLLLFIFWLFKIKWKTKFLYQLTGAISILILFVLSFMGREIIGNKLVNILDYFYFIGITNLFLLIALIIFKPSILSQKNQ